MSINPRQLEELIQEIEVEDPIDFADLPFEEDELRSLVANRLCEMMGTLDALNAEDKQLSLLATSAKLILENLVLNIQLLRKNGEEIGESSAELLQRISSKKNK